MFFLIIFLTIKFTQKKKKNKVEKLRIVQYIKIEKKKKSLLKTKKKSTTTKFNKKKI